VDRSEPRDGIPAARPPTAARPFPRLILREAGADLLDLPWELPLAEWSPDRVHFRDVPTGPSRHLVRFVGEDPSTHALKELPLHVARIEYDVLRHLEQRALPGVRPIGLAESPERGTAILVTEYLRFSIQYRRLLMRFPPGPGPHRDRLLDAMAGLLVDLHRAGVFWGDCSLANTLFRRDADKIQAFLVDAETGEIHPQLSDGQRAHDLDILVENVAFGLADLAALRTPDGAGEGTGDGLDGLDPADDAIEAAEAVRRVYDSLWAELHEEPDVEPGDRFAVRSRIRRLNDLGFAVDEIELVPASGGSRMRLHAAVSNRRFHANELERRSGVRVLEGQARILLNDLREYQAWLEYAEGRRIGDDLAAERWRDEVLGPTVARLDAIVGIGRDPIQAYCDVLEEKWLLSEAAGRDVGLDAAITAFLSRARAADEGLPIAPPPGGGSGPDVTA
jgi:hypothetical protein